MGTEQRVARVKTGQTRTRGTAGEIIQIKMKYFTRKCRVPPLFERLNGPMLFYCRVRDARHKRVLLSSAGDRFGSRIKHVAVVNAIHRAGPPGGREDRFVRLRVLENCPAESIFIVETSSHASADGACKTRNVEKKNTKKVHVN